MINVVHITENPIAGAPMSLSKCLNKYQGSEVTSWHIAASDRNETRVYDSDLLIGTHSYEQLRIVMAKADVFHFHNFYRNQELFRRYPDLWELVAKKPRVWQAHSQRSIRWMDIEEGLKDKSARHLVIGQYHPREWPECTVVPNIIDIFDSRLTPNDSRDWSGPLRVAYSPSRIGLTGWDNKGYAETTPILDKLGREGVIKAAVINDLPHHKCLARRGHCHVGIDEIVTGSYHLCSLEALSQGLIPIAGLDDIQVQTLRDLTGSDRLPWAVCRPETLEVELRYMAASPEWVEEQALTGRKWMETFWHPQLMTYRFVQIYKEL